MLATEIRKLIKKIPEGKTFGYLDLGIAREKYLTAAKALERFQKEGLIKRVSKGVFYKPKLTVFGELEPEYNELLQAYLFENGKRIAYITGTSLYNQLGLTTQMAFKIKIASRKKRIYINRGALKAGAAKSYAEITESNYKILGLLDAFKDIKKIPDCSIAQAVRRLQAIVRSLDEKQTDELLKYALMYPPRVRALVGAILESLGIENQRLDKLKNSLNPLSTFELGIKEQELPTKSNWYIG
jgi:predicted transcriptional regulator of viral defense system